MLLLFLLDDNKGRQSYMSANIIVIIINKTETVPSSGFNFLKTIQIRIRRRRLC